MTYKGSDVPKLPRPRKLILGLEPGREITVTPGTVPCTADNTLLCTRSLISSVLTEATEPVKFTFFECRIQLRQLHPRFQYLLLM